jgi:alanine racemase
MMNRREFVIRSAAAGFGAGGLSAFSSTFSLQPPASRLSFDPWLEIDRAALAHNVATIARLSGGKRVIAVTKNNAYGLGLTTAGPLLDVLPEVSTLAVVRAEEALALRKAGVKKPILLMAPASEEELVELVPMDVVQSPYRAGAPAILTRVSQRLKRPVRVHLYVDTGMHRMGMPVSGALAWAEQLAKSGAVRIEGAFTELVEDADFDRQQASSLRELQTSARAKGIEIGTVHAASSDAIQHETTETFLDAVRPGLALYGGYVSDRAMQQGGFTPAYRLKARVIRVDHLAAGEGVSYHRRWKAVKPTWIAALAVGHVDGYPSGATKGCEIMVGGKLYPVIGYVSASHTIIALGDQQTVQVGDEATLVGPDHPALHPNEVARRAGYSEYNMFMHLSPSLRRIVV